MSFRSWRCAIQSAIIVTLSAAPVRAVSLVANIAERGPATLVVGSAFTLAAPFSVVADVARRQSPALAACRFGHGLKMIVFGAPLLPLGILLSPLDHARLPSAWLDGIVDSQQEDYCTRPLTAVLP